METAFRIFMYLFPFGLSTAAYIWMFKKALRVPSKPFRWIALVVICGGMLYTLYKIVTSITTILTNDNFEFVPIIVTVVVLAIAAIFMTLGEPDETPA